MKKNRRLEFGFAGILTIVGMLVIAVVLPIATKLVQNNQENRSSAATCTPGATRCVNGVGERCFSGDGEIGWGSYPSACSSTPTCTYTCTAWSSCSNLGNQTCTNQTKSPTNCTGGTGVIGTTQKCTYTPPSFTCSGGNGKSKCEDLKMYYCNTNTGLWVFASECANGTICNSDMTACETIPTCTSFTYTWGQCDSSTGTQAATSKVGLPSGCIGGNPLTSQACAVNGVCNLSKAYGCSAGTLDKDVDNSAVYRWYCRGLNGGSDSDLCMYAKPLPAAPGLGVSCTVLDSYECSSDGKQRLKCISEGNNYVWTGVENCDCKGGQCVSKKTTTDNVLTSDTLTIEVGEDLDLASFLNPYISIAELTLESLNANIATLGVDGIVKAITSGITDFIITTKDGTSQNLTVNVIKPDLVSTCSSKACGKCSDSTSCSDAGCNWGYNGSSTLYCYGDSSKLQTGPECNLKVKGGCLTGTLFGGIDEDVSLFSGVAGWEWVCKLGDKTVDCSLKNPDYCSSSVCSDCNEKGCKNTSACMWSNLGKCIDKSKATCVDYEPPCPNNCYNDEEGHCYEKLLEGQECFYDSDCKSGMCVNRVCRNLLAAIGEGCKYGEDCVSGICVYNYKFSSSFCRGGSIGEECLFNSNCLNGRCHSGVCKDKVANGEWCSEGSDCKSDLCIDNACKDKLAAVGEGCDRDEECLSGMCVRLVCIDKLAANREGCDGNSDCLSGKCDEYHICRANIGDECRDVNDCGMDSNCVNNVCRAYGEDNSNPGEVIVAKKTCSGGDGNRKCEDLKMYYCNTNTGLWVFASECANGTICNSAKTVCVANTANTPDTNTPDTNTEEKVEDQPEGKENGKLCFNDDKCLSGYCKKGFLGFGRCQEVLEEVADEVNSNPEEVEDENTVGVLTSDILTMEVGEDLDLTSLLKSYVSSIAELTLESLNAKIATIGIDGFVKAISSGVVDLLITTKDGETENLTVNVVNPSFTSSCSSSDCGVCSLSECANQDGCMVGNNGLCITKIESIKNETESKVEDTTDETPVVAKKTCSGGDGNRKCEDLKMYYCNTNTGLWVFASECANGTICNSAKTVCVANTANTPDTNTPDTNTPDTNTPNTNTPDTNTPNTNTPNTNTPGTNTEEEVEDVEVEEKPEGKENGKLCFNDDKCLSGYCKKGFLGFGRCEEVTEEGKEITESNSEILLNNSKLSFKVTFEDISPDAKCIGSLGKLNVEILNKSTDIYKSFSNIGFSVLGNEVDSKGNQVFQVTNLEIGSEFASVDTFNNVKVKGPFHLKRRMCLENTVCDIDLANSNQVYDFSEYTLLVGDVNQDGIINSVDYSLVKNALNADATPECGRQYDLNLDGVVNSLDLNLLDSNLSLQDDG